MNKIYLTLIILIFFGCGPGEPQSITSSDSVSSITIPGNWDTNLPLNAEACIEVGNMFAEQYVAVITESKSDFPAGTTLKDYSEETRGFTISASNGSPTSPKSVNINGMPGLRVEIKGIIDGLPIIYFHVSVEGTNHFHQVIAWTLTDLEDENRDVLNSVIRSFKE